MAAATLPLCQTLLRRSYRRTGQPLIIEWFVARSALYTENARSLYGGVIYATSTG